jgi:hypothetical protein
MIRRQSPSTCASCLPNTPRSLSPSR